MRKMIVQDMTLRKLTQDNALSFRERLEIAKRLEKAGVDAIELPALTGSREEEVVCRTIASTVGCRVCIPVDGDVQAAARCLEGANAGCIQVVFPISTVQMEYMYHMKAAKMLEKIAAVCAAAKQTGCDVEFVAGDATRAEAGFAAQCCRTAAENGAGAVTLCDDGSICFPQELAELVQEIKAAVQVPVFVQPGNGLNMASACAVAAIQAGADGIKTASGAADALSADVLADILRARGEMLGAQANLDSTAIHNVLSNIGKTGAAAAKTAVAETGETLALDSSCTLADVAGAVAGLGYELTDEDMGRVYNEFRRVSARKKGIGRPELEAIVATAAMQVPSTYHVVSYVVNSGNIITATANITLEKDGEKRSGVSVGDGPIDAAFHAIEQIIGHHYELDDFQVQAVTKGREAVGSALIRLRAEGRLYSGNGISTDIVGACIRAYINALNKIVYEGK